MTHRSPLPRPGSTATTGPVRRRGAALAALLTVLLVLLAACSGGLGGSSDAGSAAGGTEDAEPQASAERAVGDVATDGMDGFGDGAPADGRRGASTAGRVAPLARQVIMTGEVTLQAEDLPAVRDEVDRLVGRYGGFVSSERSFDDDRGRLVEAKLTLRIPSPRFDQIMTDFADIATVVDPSRKAVDVTTEVIDVDSRIRTQEVSLDRLRSFLRRATTIDSTIRLESEIAEREADLASLRAQQNYLEDQTSLATITVTLRQPPEDEPVQRADDGGFLAGLHGGWAALKGVVVVGATILGAIVPFALALALVGVPVLLLVRAARRRRPAPAAAPPPA